MLILIATMAIGFIACSSSSENTRHTIIFYVKTDSGWEVYTAIRSKGNEIVTFPSDPTQSNMVFAGWYIDSLYTSEVHEYTYENEQITSDLKYYAKFVPETSIVNPYTITFNTNGGAVLTAQQYNFGKKLNPDMVTPVKYGHTFIGWYRDEALTKPWNVTYDRVWGSTTLYAKWESTGFVITYMLDGGTNNSKNSAKYKYETGLTLLDPSKLGYTFEGWFLDSEFASPYSNETLYDTDITVYAKWSIITYNIDYELGDGESLVGSMPLTYTVEDNPLELPTVNKTDYDFVGWCKDAANGTMLDTENVRYAEDLFLTSIMREHPYYITYVLDGGTNATSNPANVTAVHRTVNLSDPSKLGYTFEGWYSDSSKMTSFTSGTAIDSDITLYADWSVITYNITKHLGVGESLGSGTIPSTYTIEDTPMSLPAAIKTDNHFVGWYIDSTYTTLFDETARYAQDLDLYPLFVENALLDPADYVEMSSSAMLNLPKEVVTTDAKNICIPLTNTSISSITYNGESIAGDYIVGDSDEILVIANTVVSGAKAGYKNRIVINYTNAPSDVLYFAVFDGDTYTITPSNYYKKSSTELALNFQESITSANIYNVAIDGANVAYSVESNAITITSTIIDRLSAGSHLVELATDLGSIPLDVTIYNSDEYVPYNVKIDIDDYPNVIIRWDSAFDADSYIVKIGTGYEYTSTASASRYDGNSFDATGLLKIASQTFRVIAVKDGNRYSTDAITFGYTLYDSNASEEMNATAKNFLENSYTIYGNSRNKYITSWEEAYDLMFYMAMYGTSEAFTTSNSDYADYDGVDVCFDFDITQAEQIDFSSDFYSHRTDGVVDRHLYESEMVLSNGTFVLDFLQEVLSKLPEATKYSIAYYKLSSGLVSDQSYRIGICMDSVMAPTVNRTKTNTAGTINDNYTEIERYVRFYSSTGYTAQLPIELNNNGTASVSTSVELYQALEHGYLPVPTTSALNNLYSTIKNVLRTILDENMTEYEQVLAIYEWLCVNVLYDHDAAAQDASLQGTDEYSQIYGWSCFYMEGVFNNGLAVCNGIASAYSAMCNIMGIPCHKVTGTAKGGGHAWNEVYIGGSWYISDATWGSASVSINSTKYEVLDFEYFLMTYRQAQIDYNHIAKVSVYGKLYAYDNYVNPYSLMKFTYNGNIYDLVLDGNETENTVKANRAYNYIVQKMGTSGPCVLNFYCNNRSEWTQFVPSGYTGYPIDNTDVDPNQLIIVCIKNS